MNARDRYSDPSLIWLEAEELITRNHEPAGQREMDSSSGSDSAGRQLPNEHYEAPNRRRRQPPNRTPNPTVQRVGQTGLRVAGVNGPATITSAFPSAGNGRGVMPAARYQATADTEDEAEHLPPAQEGEQSPMSQEADQSTPVQEDIGAETPLAHQRPVSSILRQPKEGSRDIDDIRRLQNESDFATVQLPNLQGGIQGSRSMPTDNVSINTNAPAIPPFDLSYHLQNQNRRQQALPPINAGFNAPSRNFFDQSSGAQGEAWPYQPRSAPNAGFTAPALNAFNAGHGYQSGDQAQQPRLANNDRVNAAVNAHNHRRASPYPTNAREIARRHRVINMNSQSEAQDDGIYDNRHYRPAEVRHTTYNNYVDGVLSQGNNYTVNYFAGGDRTTGEQGRPMNEQPRRETQLDLGRGLQRGAGGSLRAGFSGRSQALSRRPSERPRWRPN
jgi:hypothetical protein